MLGLLLLIVGAVVITPIVLSIMAFNRVGVLRRDLTALRLELASVARAAAATAAVAARPQPEPEPEAVAAEPDPEPEPEPVAVAEPPPEAWADLEPEPVPVGPSPAPAPERPRFEERLASRWFLWVGALALALSGYFLVRYMAEQGLLGPGVRVALGILLGMALVAGGEVLRRSPGQRRIAALQPDYVPQALVAGGLAALYASVYAAYALYGFIGPLPAFALLAAVSFAAFALAVLQGALVAIVGLLGAYATPALIETTTPSAAGLFTYLTLVVAASAALLVWRPWPWLGPASILAAALWVALWLADQYGTADAVPVGLFVAVIAAAFLGAAAHLDRSDRPTLWDGLRDLPVGDFAGVLAAAVGAGLMLVYLAVDGYSPAAIAMLAVFALVLGLAAIARERLDAAALLAGAVVLVGFAGWAARLWITVHASDAPGSVWAERTDEEARLFLRLAALFGAGFAAAGYWRLWQSVRPVLWAALSSLVPLALMIIAYARLRGLHADAAWAVAALVVAAGLVGAVSRLLPHEHDRPMALALGVYALATVAAVSLAMVFVLRDAWLTVALSLQLPAMAWIAGRLGLPELRKAALVVAAIVLVRLALNTHVLAYDADHWLGRHWVLYGYGIPLLAFHAAWRMFDRRDDHLDSVLEGGRIGLLVLLISAEIRIVSAGSLAARRLGLAEAALHTVSWLTMAWTRWRAWNRAGRAIDRYAAAILTAMGLAMLVFISLLAANPVLSVQAVGRLPVVNVLAIAYLAPAVLLLLILRETRDLLSVPVLRAGGAGVLALTLVWLSMATRHVFTGERMWVSGLSTAESYAYSAVWLAYALALLGAAIVTGREVLRYGSIAVLVLVVLKVFLVDMSDLDGLYRVASFLGLGLALVGIGFVYQRYVFAPAAAAPKAATDEAPS